MRLKNGSRVLGSWFRDTFPALASRQAGWQTGGGFTQMQMQEVVERVPVQKMVTEYQEVRRQVQVPVQMVPQQVQVISA